jgi:ankyrin repeat protein
LVDFFLGQPSVYFLAQRNCLSIPNFENKKMQNGYTALLCAAYYGHADAVEILIEHGADVDHQDKVKSSRIDIREVERRYLKF